MKALDAQSRAMRIELSRPVIDKAKGVLHLGGHLGQESKYYTGLNKSVIWVEAIPDVFTRLQENVSTVVNQHAYCALLGGTDGKQTKFNISNNIEGVSSSIYEFGEYGSGVKSLWPKQKLSMVNSITLPMIRLDTLVEGNNIDIQSYDYWVIDLQGAEIDALKGSGKSLQHCNALSVEVSTVEVYSGGALWPDLKKFLGQNGFYPLWEPALPHDDVLFVRSENHSTTQTKSSVDLRNIPIFWVTIESMIERHKEMSKLFNILEFSDTHQVNGKIVLKDGKQTRQIQLEKSHYAAMSHAFALQKPGPVLILEDDCWFTDSFTPILQRVPADADAIYLGTSVWGMVNGKSVNRGARIEQIDDDWDRPLNMLGIHAVLYLTENYKERTIDNLLRAKYVGMCCDETIAVEMKDYKIYSCVAPMLYQRDGHNEIATSTKLRSIDNKIHEQ